MTELHGEELITAIYNAFNPFQPLQAGDPLYVDFHKVRGEENIFNEVGKKIVRSERPTCQLYTGHRGVGKSTELLRLKDYLEKKGCFVVYFGATEGDIDEQDAQYTDILLASTRHILDDLKDYANPGPLVNWLKSRWQELKDLALSEVSFDKMQIEMQIAMFAKLTANLRQVPNSREIIRKQVDLHTISLTKALNEFIEEAKQHLPGSKKKLVVIADNLDRIVPVMRPNGRNNHDEIFLDRSQQLKSLDCHVIYTVPISLVYSDRATELRDNYDTPQILPMIMVQTRQGERCEPGIAKLRELLVRRIGKFTHKFSLDTEIFADEATRLRLCNMSGGHVREMMLLMQTSLDWTDKLPIEAKAVQRAITEARNNTYRNAVDEEDWLKLAQVAKTKRILNDEEYRQLLFSRCVLEYRELKGDGEIERWHNVHPLIRDIGEFKEAMGKI